MKQGEAAAGFARHDRVLHCENVPLPEIAARFGTPTYVYSRRAIDSALRAYTDALAGRRALVCYAMKANSNLAVLNLVARAGCGFDIVSGGELVRAIAAGADPGKIVFSGVSKSEAEIEQALRAGILCCNVESTAELELIEKVAARMQQRARISVRVNPDVDPKTHPYIATGLEGNKFGVAYGDTLALYQRAARMSHIAVVGIDCHIGSQIIEVAPYVAAAERVFDLVDQLARVGIQLQHIDFGGGLGIRYRAESPPSIGELIAALLACADARGHGDKTILFEPGRSIVGNAGVLLTRVNLLKATAAKNFAIVDAAMNDLLRPALYQAWMSVLEVAPSTLPNTVPVARYDIVGPICESGDWLARERDLALAAGDLVAIAGAGAYGMAMASNYNSRPRAAEVMVDGEQAFSVRRRETVTELFASESTLP